MVSAKSGKERGRVPDAGTSAIGQNGISLACEYELGLLKT